MPSRPCLVQHRGVAVHGSVNGGEHAAQAGLQLRVGLQRRPHSLYLGQRRRRRRSTGRQPNKASSLLRLGLASGAGGSSLLCGGRLLAPPGGRCSILAGLAWGRRRGRHCQQLSIAQRAAPTACV
jgi:hypothetical protein